MRFVLAMLQGFAAMAGGYGGIYAGFFIASLVPRHSLARPDEIDVAVGILVLLLSISCGTVGFTIGWRRVVMDGYERWRNASPGRSTAK